MAMNIMVGGDGVTSYAKNSRLQEKAILITKPVVEKAIKEVYNSLQPESLVVADLGCSSSPNTFVVISEIVEAIGIDCRKLGHNPPEIQYFLNDLPGNDFNTLFHYSEKFKEKLKEVKGEESIVPYMVGVPGSFYGRLFPRHNVHFFHSSYSLHWLSQVPQGLESDTGIPLNKGNIYIGKSSPQIVVEAYLKQFQKDFSTFLRFRFEELVLDGRMVMTFLGRKTKTPCGELSSFFGLLTDALNAMVLEGLMNGAIVDGFNIPNYAPSMEEVMTIVEITGLFHVEQVDIFETNWDPFDDSSDDDDYVFDNIASGQNVASCIRAVVEPMFVKFFGDAIMDELFSRYAKNVAMHLSVEKGKHVVFVMALRK